MSEEAKAIARPRFDRMTIREIAKWVYDNAFGDVIELRVSVPKIAAIVDLGRDKAQVVAVLVEALLRENDVKPRPAVTVPQT